MNDDLKNFLRGVVGIVEATDFEQHILWERWHNRIQWEPDNSGRIPCIGQFHGSNIYVSLFTAKLAGRKVLFWHATSSVVDYGIIYEWLEKNLSVDRYATDAQNFHIIVHDIERMNEDATV